MFYNYNGKYNTNYGLITLYKNEVYIGASFTPLNI